MSHALPKEGEGMEEARAIVPAAALFQDLYLCTAGKSMCYPGHSFGPDIRLNYLIHYVLKGRGVFETDHRQYHLVKGQGFLIEPGQTTRYEADARAPWTYIWIGFNGTLAPRILEELGLGQAYPVFSCKQAFRPEEILEDFFGLESEGVILSLDQHVLLLSFLHAIAQNLVRETEHKRLEGGRNYHIDKALEFIRANYSNQLHVSDLASYLGISRYHLFRLFQENLGQSPQEYITSFSLGQARELLTTTSFSIQEVAFLCGYSNAEIFSKAFKKKYGISPSKYRRYALEYPGIDPAEFLDACEERSNDAAKPAGFTK